MSDAFGYSLKMIIPVFDLDITIDIPLIEMLEREKLPWFELI